ncbi:MAG: XTP/dITP diphosphatase [archaeon YNP-LCB-003-016]|jgi:XTP/dITP diphosphohydrolase|uniref:XTP/dITP diphosphatase n=1 Tax=Candidatus Culexarchaeum yellowstonense TaxID=2928963 RepID=UPI0026E956D8|nr:XTP/dITP diphosphatase [Candidatus Culexarchaeum yellowstonense]MCR6690926.1 XTP/dITP diphosphatase [Candidatus Culexarchaeum yellowstonense]
MSLREELKQTSILFISKNKNKFIEASHILSSFNIKLEWAPFSKLEIQSSSLSDIALFAARNAFESIKKPLIVEDDGLFIKALNGFPGPFSSYIYSTIGLNGILRLMEGVDDRECFFESAVAFCNQNISKVFVGRVYGEISRVIRGSCGFGFDPIFIPKGENLTFAEMPLNYKCSISHRAVALKDFARWFLKNFKYYL